MAIPSVSFLTQKRYDFEPSLHPLCQALQKRPANPSHVVPENDLRGAFELLHGWDILGELQALGPLIWDIPLFARLGLEMLLEALPGSRIHFSRRLTIWNSEVNWPTP